LAEALKSGHLAGAAIDVYPREPEGNGQGFESPLRGLPNVLLSPHIGGSTQEAQENIGREVGGVLIKFVNSGTTTGAVNFPQVEPPAQEGRHRILNVHRNVPGVLSRINKIVSDAHANIESQVLATDPNIGYLIMDLNQSVSDEVRAHVAALDTRIRRRILSWGPGRARGGGAGSEIFHRKTGRAEEGPTSSVPKWSFDLERRDSPPWGLPAARIASSPTVEVPKTLPSF